MLLNHVSTTFSNIKVNKYVIWCNYFWSHWGCPKNWGHGSDSVYKCHFLVFVTVHLGFYVWSQKYKFSGQNPLNFGKISSKFMGHICKWKQNILDWSQLIVSQTLDLTKWRSVLILIYDPPILNSVNEVTAQ